MSASSVTLPTRARCASCGKPSVATRIVDVPGLGLRRHDSCRDAWSPGSSRSGRSVSSVHSERYHGTLAAGGRVVAHG